MKPILHIINGYCGNKAYRNLVTALDVLGIRQWIYIPIRSPKDQSRYQNFDLKDAAYTYSHVIQSVIDRLFYFRKIRRISHDIEQNDNFSTDLLIHAHTLFSDGGAAMKLHRKHQMEYIVAVRNTDVNLFFKYFFFLRVFGEKILLNAKYVVFLSPAYQEKVLTKYVSPRYRVKIGQKSKVIPNAIDPFWLTNTFHPSTFQKEEVRLLYVGEIRRNKNLHAILEAIRFLRYRVSGIRFQVVGFGLNDEKGYVRRIRKLCESLPNVELIDQVSDKEELIRYYRKADIFIMPSFTETFGLVYAEAMSQGLPLIYSKGQGIDGYFEDGEAGYAVDPGNPADIADKMEKIMDRYTEISRFCYENATLFSRERIGMMVKNLYES